MEFYRLPQKSDNTENLDRVIGKSYSKRENAGLSGRTLHDLIFVSSQFLHIELAGMAELCAFSLQIPDPHLFRFIQRDCQILASVQLLADDAGTEGVRIQPFHQIEQGRSVVPFDQPLVLVVAFHFLRKIDGIVFSLFESQARLVVQLAHGNDGFLCQRMAAPQINVRVAREQFHEFKPVLLEKFRQDFFIEIV